ncbi:MAG: transcriptional repressor LexA [Phycisphaerae bacterium]|nr:transcriptional repressor LexA [Phycisphaerae bacterium]
MTLTLTPKQMHVFQLVRDWRQTRGFSPTMQELANELGVSKVTVFEHVEALIKKGALTRDKNKARSLSLAEDAVLPHELDDDSSSVAGQIGASGAPVKGLHFPLVGRIAAGMPVEKFAQEEDLRLEELFATKRGQRSTMFALQVDGWSMRDEGIHDGDYVIVERRETARNGERVVALLPNGETTLKTFHRERDGRIRLQPANPDFEPIIVDDCEVQGVVIGVLRRY